MLSATCHCGALRIEIPQRPTEITNCNCSMCRRLGSLWAYFEFGSVKVHGHPAQTQAYIQGDKTLQTLRCKTCGCVTHWEPIGPKPGSRMGVNVRNFDPEIIGNVRMRLLDGAESWTSTFWEPPTAQTDRPLALIRPYEARDADGIAALILPIQQQEFGIAVTREDQPDLADIAGFYQTGAGNFWVAEIGGQVVGSIGLLDIGRAQAALRKMFVAAPHRGRASGVAQALLDTLVSWSEAKSLSSVWLGTTSKFLAAHRFYEKNGFAEVSKAELPAAFPVMAVDSKFYCRSTARR